MLSVDLTRVPAWGPVAACFVRLTLAAALNALTAAGLALSGHPDAWVRAGDYMPVWATGVDIGSLGLLAVLLRREGRSIRELVGRPRWADVPVAVAVLLGLGAVGATGGGLSGLLLYGTFTPPPPFGHLPLWAGLYATFIWPVLWGFTEETTYNAYAAPRLASRFGRLAPALAIVTLGWAGQHMALPMKLDLTFAAWRFLSSMPIALVAVPLYLRTGRLWPIILAHIAIDMASGALTLIQPA